MTAHGQTVECVAERRLKRDQHLDLRDTVAFDSTACLAPSSRVSRFGPGRPARLSSASYSLLWGDVHLDDRLVAPYDLKSFCELRECIHA